MSERTRDFSFKRSDSWLLTLLRVCGGSVTWYTWTEFFFVTIDWLVLRRGSSSESHKSDKSSTGTYWSSMNGCACSIYFWSVSWFCFRLVSSFKTRNSYDRMLWRSSKFYWFTSIKSFSRLYSKRSFDISTGSLVLGSSLIFSIFKRSCYSCDSSYFYSMGSLENWKSFD